MNKKLLSLVIASFLTACNSGNNSTSAPPVVVDPPAPEPQLVTFSPDGALEATITRTTWGVPHIKADNLESLGFGSAYAQAQDQLCIIADGIVKANSERSKYFGPHKSLNLVTGELLAEDNGNLISDFGYKALKVRAMAEANYDSLSERTRALVEGFVKGYNQYLVDLEEGQVSTTQFCVGQPWLQPISPVDVITYTYSVALLPGASNFLDLIFFANPGDGDEYLPRPVAPQGIAKAAQSPEHQKQVDDFMADIKQAAIRFESTLTTPEVNPADLGSNGWGLGKEMTENGRGMVLGNPHFPHTGNIRFWQSHITIPGVLDVMGGSLAGMPGPINIGFNDNIAWTHTFSTAEHFIVYNLTLAGDRTTYAYDAATKPINKERVVIDVNIGGGNILPLEKEIYVTDIGPMLEALPQLAPFGWTDTSAFAIQDANEANSDMVDHWFAMNLAKDMTEFKQAFKDFDGVIFNNTMAADKEGNAFYIDDSTVPGLSTFAKTALISSPEIQALRQMAGFTILPGSDSRFSFSGAEPYENAPKLDRTDYVQNSNDSYWSTNLNAPLEGYPRLYGNERYEQTLRSRMGQKLLIDSAGEDGKFSPAEVEQALMSNRAYLAESVLEDLIAQCTTQGAEPVQVADGVAVNISASCAALQQWNGKQDDDSIGGHIIREFAHLFDTSKHFTVPFNYQDAANTPHTLTTDGSALVVLAHAQLNIEKAGWAMDATLGDLQFTEKSLPTGFPSGVRTPWPGSHNAEGGFNVFATRSNGDDTLIPKHEYVLSTDALTGQANRSGLGEHGYHIRYGSSWMMVVSFTDDGPEARGILSYSQSNDAASPHLNDQSVYYSENKSLRPVLFKQSDIDANTISTVTVSIGSTE